MRTAFYPILFLFPALNVFAYSGASATPESGLLRMTLGLLLVLAVFAGLAWVVKRMMPKISGNASLIEVKGGVSIGSRERVVVVQVADRLIVVGVAPGHITALANLDAEKINAPQISMDPSEFKIVEPGVKMDSPEVQLNEPAVKIEQKLRGDEGEVAKQSFAQWLKNAASKF